MKKSLKTILTTLSLVFVICFSLFAVACSNKNNKVASNNIATNVVDENSEKEYEDVNNSNENETTEKQEPSFDINSLNGIYKYTSTEYTFDDKYFTDLAELVKFFNTTDANGVFYAVKNLGFDEFLANIVFDKTYNKPKAILINNGQVLNVSYDPVDTFVYLDSSKNFTITANKNIISASRTDVLFEENGETISIYYQFTYVNDSNETVSTPLYIKTTLEKQANSSNLFSGKEFAYILNTLKLNISPVSTLDKDAYLEIISQAVKNSLGYDDAFFEKYPELKELFQNDKIISSIENFAKLYKFFLLDDLSIKAESNPIFHVFVNNNGEYSSESTGFTGRITSRIINDKCDIINLEITIADDATLTLSLIAR